MILVCGVPTEEPVALVIEAARRRRLPLAVLDQRKLGQFDLQISHTSRGINGRMKVNGVSYSLDAFTGVYNRLIGDSAGPFELLHTWFEVARCPVLNRNSAMATNGSKPYQTQLIRQCGLNVPDTLVTNDAAALHEFHAKHPRLIYKSISAIRSIVREFNPHDARLARLRALPTQFQEFIPGDNVRVHVVGARVFATLIQGDAIDYRYAARDGKNVAMQPMRLPATIAAKCRQVAKLLNLPLCGIDFKRTPQGRWVCFEANPSPAFSYYQHHTGQDIAGAIARLLAKPLQ
jgi:glutathione synthase/RimK-type ligase-like ATP-grasp enzyme